MSARKKLLDAAAQLAATEGVQGLSVERVVTAAGVSKGAFFYHFETKEQMIGALVDHVSTIRMADVDADTMAGKSFATTLLKMIESELLEGGQLTGVCVSAVLLDPTLRDKLTARRADWRKRLIEEDGFTPQRAEQLLLSIDGALIGTMLYNSGSQIENATKAADDMQTIVANK